MKPDELAKRVCKLSKLPESSITKLHIIDALKEYGDFRAEETRRLAVSVCETLKASRENQSEWAAIRRGALSDCAAAIEKMELP